MGLLYSVSFSSQGHGVAALGSNCVLRRTSSLSDCLILLERSGDMKEVKDPLRYAEGDGNSR